MISSRRYAVAAFAIGVAVCAVDVVSKILVVSRLSGHPPMTLLGGLITLQLYRNAGAAFGVGPSFTAIYALVAAAVPAAILRVSGRLQSWLWASALGLVLGGAAGNLADRVFRSPGPMRGWVIDWIKLPYFPETFNIADSALTLGVVLLVLASLRSQLRREAVRIAAGQ
ncbi:MAG: signal peptidase II [Streptosporangiaceae bacterium]